MSKQNFPEDEFDVAEGTRPRGVHRAPEPWWRWMLPFVVVLVVVPGLAWGLMYMLSPATPEDVQAGNGATASTASTPDSDSTAEGDETAGSAEESSAAPSAELPGSDESDQSDESAQSGAVNHDVNVRVLNGVGKQGLAAQVAGTLKNAGYAKNSADNARNWASKVSAVYYSDKNLKATAEDIAKRLKISEVKSEPKSGKNEVVVLLRKDFRQ